MSQTLKTKQRRLAPLALAGVALCWVGLDQLTKIWALHSLTPRQHKQVLGETLQWFLTYNPGAAFSFLSGATWVFTILSAVVIIALATQARHIVSYRWATVLGLIMGGACGNLIDRLLRPPGFAVGHVVDFIYTPWLLPAVYNVADIGLTLAVPAAIVLLLCNVPAKTTAPTPEEKETS